MISEISGKEKLGIPAVEPVRLVLESDGTQVEDGEYFRTLPNNTVILILRQGERWYPVGVDVIKTGNLLFLIITCLCRCISSDLISTKYT